MMNWNDGTGTDGWGIVMFLMMLTALVLLAVIAFALVRLSRPGTAPAENDRLPRENRSPIQK